MLRSIMVATANRNAGALVLGSRQLNVALEQYAAQRRRRRNGSKWETSNLYKGVQELDVSIGVGSLCDRIGFVQ